jgi:hypothetical protein
MKVSFYGNISSGGIIRSSIADVFLMDQGAGQDSDVKIETITVTPNPTATIGLDDSDFGFTTDIDLTYDSGLS